MTVRNQPVGKTNDISRMRPDAPRLSAFGAHPVGVRTLRLVNRGQTDITNESNGATVTRDRTLVTELWYPAAKGTRPGTRYETLLRDGVRPVTLQGYAARDATPAKIAPCPVVMISHGYPGNRYLMGHLAENLASKGYIVASINHQGSLYSDMGQFASTLLNRPLDQRFVLDQLATRVGLTPDLAAITDTSNTAVIGFSMGGYGALVFGGAGIAPDFVDNSLAPPDGLLARHVTGDKQQTDLVDDRVKAVIAFGPWGMNNDVWNADGLAKFAKPLMVVAGSADDTSGYADMRKITALTTGTTRHLLTFLNAGHNAGASIPAPAEAWEASKDLEFHPFEHYADPVWDTLRMNNIAQHYVTAFCDTHLKGETAHGDILTSTPDNNVGADQGFANGTGAGLRFETLHKGETGS